MSREKQIELKPCPFCGGEGELTEHWEPIGMGANVRQFYVRCKSCCAHGGMADEMFENGDLRAKAIERWDRRADNEPSNKDDM